MKCIARLIEEGGSILCKGVSARDHSWFEGDNTPVLTGGCSSWFGTWEDLRHQNHGIRVLKLSDNCRHRNYGVMFAFVVLARELEELKGTPDKNILGAGNQIQDLDAFRLSDRPRSS